MALDSWLTKMKSAISVRTTMKPTIGILAFEVSSLMSKLLHLWRSLSDTQISKLHHETIALEGIRKVVSDDDDFLLRLACAEFTEILRSAADSISILSKKCTDQELRTFDRAFKEYMDSGSDPNRWAMSWKEMDSKAKKMDRYIASTASLYKEMEELSDSEIVLQKLLQTNHFKPAAKNGATISEVQQRIYWQRQEIKYLKQSSLWGCSPDSAVYLLARACFTIVARIKHVFGISSHAEAATSPTPPRNSSVSAAVYPSSPLSTTRSKRCGLGLFELRTSIISCPPETTLGAAALAMHYANVISIIEKMIRVPRAVGPDARDDLYRMLPGSVRGMLRSRLSGIGYGVARDEVLAVEWMTALNRIMEWLWPLANNTIKWQGERSFERRNATVGRSNVMVLETLYFANKEKVEAAVTELLVGLNYIWRFEIEMRLDY